MDLAYHGGTSVLVSGCTLAVLETLALDQPGQACILVSKLGQRCTGTGVLHFQHLVQGHFHCFPMILDGFTPVTSVGDSDIGAFGLGAFGAHAPSQGVLHGLDLFHPTCRQVS